ncbi:MAG TPA: 2-oxoacid:acceptor oxidoreductase subunit alpha [Terriglobia bacterium]|nr:2-oxoacid:acceptor oxidoreductase subunit alpha [Terriglobia bacterium]
MEEDQRSDTKDLIINDFSIQVATVNGSGSQSSNTVLMRSIFQMGIPVSGKNLFPSNIAGLPTWFTIRANKAGWIARRKEIDFLVAMNADTAREDVMSLEPDRVVVYEETLNLKQLRKDLHFFPIPFAKLAAGITTDARLRKLLANMIYVGVVGELMDIDPAEMDVALTKQFKGKAKAIALNNQALEVGRKYAAENLDRGLAPYRCERMDATKGKIIIDGNSAAALGCMFAGITVATWYPITPSSSLCETLADYMRDYRHEENGKATYAIVQAEDELAAVGMAIGAGWAGARSMTSTAGPGISLMNEFIGLAYYAEIPVVIFDITRVGPSTGLPTRTQQSDILAMVHCSHGDTKHIVLLPCSVSECFDMAVDAFDLTERFQTPVFVMSDLDLGMNNWMSDTFKYPTRKFDRGKVLTAEDLKRLGSFKRYADVDGDGIGYRTLPGTDHPAAAYFTRGSGHNEKALYSERPDDYKNNMDRLAKKYETARGAVPQPEVEYKPDAKIGFLAFGTTHWAIIESEDQLQKEYGMSVSYYRLRAVPFTKHLVEFFEKHDRVYVVEQNRDAQMAALIKLELSPELGAKIRSILHYSGLPIDARFVTDALVAAEKGEQK